MKSSIDSSPVADLEVAEELPEGRDAVAGVDPMGVADLLAGRVGRVVVQVEEVHGRAFEELQAPEAGTPLVEVVDVGQDAGCG